MKLKLSVKTSSPQSSVFSTSHHHTLLFTVRDVHAAIWPSDQSSSPVGGCGSSLGRRGSINCRTMVALLPPAAKLPEQECWLFNLSTRGRHFSCRSLQDPRAHLQIPRNAITHSNPRGLYWGNSCKTRQLSMQKPEASTAYLKLEMNIDRIDRVLYSQTAEKIRGGSRAVRESSLQNKSRTNGVFWS